MATSYNSPGQQQTGNNEQNNNMLSDPIYRVAAQLADKLWTEKNVIVKDKLLLFSAADLVLSSGWTLQQAADHIISRGGMS